MASLTSWHHGIDDIMASWHHGIDDIMAFKYDFCQVLNSSSPSETRAKCLLIHTVPVNSWSFSICSLLGLKEKVFRHFHLFEVFITEEFSTSEVFIMNLIGMSWVETDIHLEKWSNTIYRHNCEVPIHLVCRFDQVLCILTPEKVLNSCEITMVLKKSFCNHELTIKLKISPCFQYQPPPKDILDPGHFYPPPSG